MTVKIDTHIHSVHSADSRMTLSEILNTAQAKGLNGVAVCDHERVFLDEIPAHEVQVIRGGEFATEYGHLIGLFLTREVARGDFKTLCEEIHAQGGIAVLAHPFQHTTFLHKLADAVPYIDGVEVFNSRAGRKDRAANQKAYAFAKEHHLLFFGGSDAHFPQEIGNAYLETECRGDLKEALLSGKGTVFGMHSPAVFAAKSVGISRQKNGKKKPLRQAAFYLKCLLEDGLRKKEKSYVTYRQDR